MEKDKLIEAFLIKLLIFTFLMAILVFMLA